MYVCMYVCMYVVCMYVCVCTCVCVCLCIHTYVNCTSMQHLETVPVKPNFTRYPQTLQLLLKGENGQFQVSNYWTKIFLSGKQ